MLIADSVHVWREPDGDGTVVVTGAVVLVVVGGGGGGPDPRAAM